MSTGPIPIDELPRKDESEADVEEKALVDALAQSGFVMMEALTRIGASYDLSLTQMRVLGILRDHTPRMADLAEYLGLEKSTVSGLVDRAVRRGLLERKRNAEDGRGVGVFMTAAGLELAERVYAEIARMLAPASNRLTAQERQTLTQLLMRMLEASHK